MKIAIICYNHFDATISLGKYLNHIDEDVEVHFIFIMSQSFLDVEIMTLKNGQVNNGFVSKQKLAENIDGEIFNYLNKEVSFDVFVLNSYKLADPKNFKLIFELKNAIVNNKYDVLHFVGNNRWIISLNFLFRNFPKIHTLHEPYPFDEFSKYRLFRYRQRIKMLINSDSHIVVPSLISFDRFNKHFKMDPGRLCIIPFGPLEIFKAYSSADVLKQCNVILYYGYISRYKGVDILVSAMKMAIRVNPDLKFIIAGEGEFDHDISAIESNLTLINRHLTNKEIAEFNQKATIVVCPYISASQSGVVMTSFAFNNPIVATNVGALPEFVEDKITGTIIEPRDPEILSRAIVDLFATPGAIEKMRGNIKSKYSNSEKSWLNIAKQHFILYQNQIALKSDGVAQNS